MKTNVYLGLALRIIVLFGVGMFWTYIPEQLSVFFGDEVVETKYGEVVRYGARHIWYNIMMSLLFVLSLVNVIIQSVNLIKKNYNTKNW